MDGRRRLLLARLQRGFKVKRLASKPSLNKRVALVKHTEPQTGLRLTLFVGLGVWALNTLYGSCVAS